MIDKTPSSPAFTPSISRRSFLKLTAAAAIELALLGASGWTYTTTIEPDWVAVEQVTLRLPRLAKEFHGYRLLQISDLHMDEWMTPERLRAIVTLVNRQKPDLIAITGDFVSHRPALYAGQLSQVISQLQAGDGVIAVLGNHDHWTDALFVRRCLVKSNIRELENIHLTLQRGNAQLHLAGVDDVWECKDRLAKVLSLLPPQGAAILLAHEPDFADTSAATGRFDLQISGHSHGGQVILPFLGPPIVPYLAQKYPLGHYWVGTQQLYTNRGLGMVGPPHIRFNCRPEVTAFTLESPLG